jgi:hypothetical protein
MTPPRLLHIPASGPTLIIHDAFGGSGTVNGRSPDTVDDGTNWSFRQYLSDLDFVVSSGTMYSQTDSSRSHVVLPTGKTSITVEAEFVQSSVTTDDGRIALVIGSSSANDNSRISVQENNVVLQDISGGSFTNTTLDTSIGLSASTLYRMVATLSGTSFGFEIIDDATSTTMSSVSGTAALANGSVGIWLRRATSSTYCSDFKVYT